MKNTRTDFTQMEAYGKRTISKFTSNKIEFHVNIISMNHIYRLSSVTTARIFIVHKTHRDTSPQSYRLDVLCGENIITIEVKLEHMKCYRSSFIRLRSAAIINSRCRRSLTNETRTRASQLKYVRISGRIVFETN